MQNSSPTASVDVVGELQLGKMSTAKITKSSTKSVKKPDEFYCQHWQADGAYKEGNCKENQAVFDGGC